MWGKEKNKQSMTMGKLRRSLNYQVHIGTLKRISKNHYYINVSQKEETSTKIANDCPPKIHYVNEKEKYRNSCQSENSRYRQSIEEKDVTSPHQSIINQVTDNDFLQSINCILSEFPTTITIPTEVDSENNEKDEVAFSKPIFDKNESNLVTNGTENILSKINISQSNNIQSLVSRPNSALPPNSSAESEVKYYLGDQSVIPNSSVIQNHIDETASLPLDIPLCDFDLYLQNFEDMN